MEIASGNGRVLAAECMKTAQRMPRKFTQLKTALCRMGPMVEEPARIKRQEAQEAVANAKEALEESREIRGNTALKEKISAYVAVAIVVFGTVLLRAAERPVALIALGCAVLASGFAFEAFERIIQSSVRAKLAEAERLIGKVEGSLQGD